MPNCQTNPNSRICMVWECLGMTDKMPRQYIQPMVTVFSYYEGIVTLGPRFGLTTRIQIH